MRKVPSVKPIDYLPETVGELLDLIKSLDRRDTKDRTRVKSQQGIGSPNPLPCRLVGS